MVIFMKIVMSRVRIPATFRKCFSLLMSVYGLGSEAALVSTDKLHLTGSMNKYIYTYINLNLLKATYNTWGLELLLEFGSIFTLQYIKVPIINDLRSIWSSEGFIRSV
jgi:hypothetical protein